MDDTISRLAVIQIIEKMRARIGHNLERAVGRAMIEILDEVGRDVDRLPSALGTNLAEVGTDAISRDAVKELLNNNGLPYHINPVLWKELNDLPPAQPKIGRWIHDGSKWTNRWICSECGYKWFFDCIEGAYCPNCGAEMEVTT